MPPFGGDFGSPFTLCNPSERAVGYIWCSTRKNQRVVDRRRKSQLYRESLLIHEDKQSPSLGLLDKLGRPTVDRPASGKVVYDAQIVVSIIMRGTVREASRTCTISE